MIEWLGYFALFIRIVMLGSERIFLKKLSNYDSTVVSSIFFLGASILLLPSLMLVPIEELVLNHFVILSLIPSFIYAIGFYLYVNAIAAGDTSLVAPLYNSNLFWLLIFGVIFLGEPIGLTRVLGALIMFLGILLLYPGSVRAKISAMSTSKASKYMILGSVFIAVGRTMDTLLIRDINFVYYAFLTNLGIGLFLFLLIVKEKKIPIVKELLNNDLRQTTVVSIVNGYSYLFLLLAISYLGVTIAEPLSLLSVFVTAILAKTLLNEKVEERLQGIIVMFIGAFLLLQ